MIGQFHLKVFLTPSCTLSYRQKDEKENVSENPIPGALWLFGTVIAGGAGYSRWRKKRKQTA